MADKKSDEPDNLQKPDSKKEQESKSQVKEVENEPEVLTITQILKERAEEEQILNQLSKNSKFTMI